MQILLYVILPLVGLILGWIIRWLYARFQLSSSEQKAERVIQEALKEAGSRKREILLEAKDQLIQERNQIERETRERRNEVQRIERRLLQKEENLDKRFESNEKKEKNLLNRERALVDKEHILEKEQIKCAEELERVSKLSQEQAKAELLIAAEKEHQQILLEKINRLTKEGQEELNKKAQKIIALAMQRYAASQASEITSTSVSLPSDDLKGRVIGKEGRNIKTLEKLTGVEILVDDTPGAVVISGFDPIRRQVAKMALEKLLLDGRIQPARIEETIEEARKKIGEKIQEAGEAAVYDVGVAGLNPQLIKVLGRLRFRTSYGQNVLLHSLEVAHLSGAIASELGANVDLVKKAGLFHDIGKAVDHEIQGSHVEIGRKILKKFDIDEKVIEAMQSHHEEYPFESLESIIVQVADAISGSRPGARKDTLEAYLKRLEELENIANSFKGVEKAYAIQAGREIRVFVQPEEVDDLEAHKLAKKIAEQIHQELKYPGEIKVNVIRETRVVEYAR